jgi:hypothetical protein
VGLVGGGVEAGGGEALGGFVGGLFGEEAVVLDYELGRGGAPFMVDFANFSRSFEKGLSRACNGELD